ncbi:antitoxin Xre/MbcA/ParS toxin-binding domain-containing protein [Pseudoalteromonas nigrifaciens]|uniref:antitoxin Xre/MbcA/ParS toxin-binding domain-containing protein n=1 Tax=Pseudoalteromonas nigrifaciens TaxID=28109 RepID=UPI001866B755|nr:antitoxin Xre/MbcA/ParS toxin-binding domain-containing protein [Pseudoalteromonas nigrifaciens]
MNKVQHISTKHDFLNVVTLGKLNTHSNPMPEIAIVKEGLTTAGLCTFSTLMQWELSTLAKVLGTTKRTLLRNKDKPLNKQISENAIEVARLSNFGIAYFSSIDNWNTWLDTPNVQFDNQPARAIMNSIRGRELIRRVISGLQHGFTA